MTPRIDRSESQERCPECWGLLPNHGRVHERFPQGGGGLNRPCSMPALAVAADNDAKEGAQ